MRRSRLMLAPALAIALTAGPAMAQQRDQKEQGLEETARSAIESLMDVMRTVIDKIPMYEAPMILDNGDILIKRKRPEDAPQPKPPNEGQQQKT
jgi:hypothetical protein